MAAVSFPYKLEHVTKIGLPKSGLGSGLTGLRGRAVTFLPERAALLAPSSPLTQHLLTRQNGMVFTEVSGSHRHSSYARNCIASESAQQASSPFGR